MKRALGKKRGLPKGKEKRRTTPPREGKKSKDNAHDAASGECCPVHEQKTTRGGVGGEPSPSSARSESEGQKTPTNGVPGRPTRKYNVRPEPRTEHSTEKTGGPERKKTLPSKRGDGKRKR